MRRIIILAAALTALHAHAADWQNIATDKGARIDIDRASLLPSDPGKKIVWMRLVMSPEDATREGYHTLKALNRYDCRGNRYATIKRVYLREDMTVMREERVDGESESAVQAGTADAKLFREVCQPPTTGELKKVALQAAEAAQKAATPAAKDAKEPAKAEARHAGDTRKAPEAGKDAEPKKPLVDIRPSIRHADLKAEAEAAKAEVAQAPHGAKAPAARSEPHAAAKPEAKPAAAHADAKAALPEARPRIEAVPIRVADERKRVLADLERTRQAGAEHAHAPVRQQVALANHAPSPAMPVATGARDTHTGTGHDVHWSYEGETGPDHWGKLKPEWKACASGERQSPIDIRDGIRVDQEPVRFYYKPSGFGIVDNGHTVQVNVTAGNRIQIIGRDFELVQFHFHRPSEERVNGKLYDMVVHLVHKDKDGRLAVVAVLMDKGEANPTIQTLWNAMPLERNVEVPVPVALDLESFLPQERKYFSYMGSLTTPPCTEGVLWIVMRNPVNVAPEQVAAFSRLYPNNARPIQQVAGRLIKESR